MEGPLQYQTLSALSPTMRPRQSEDPSEPYLPPPGLPGSCKGFVKEHYTRMVRSPGRYRCEPGDLSSLPQGSAPHPGLHGALSLTYSFLLQRSTCHIQDVYSSSLPEHLKGWKSGQCQEQKGGCLIPTQGL